ncbi:hypothetical protein EG346_19770 [Chryseobacterium carnipullorum]|uniref:Uncharacterized protein n=1 Tax=Chryseobacterium carnipullorum TaxID=1124835 RepID=A0A376DYM3_CHRCU|nr:hypothetical protein [Chryseobacterium carnipullorum]AZA50274.1 hypothetical protein EG346_19770 [Chryseobacterium carnipullorum]AZA65147.1 hypothetical protein EG345_10815 [Chryseobacterium carnipullorum]STC98215.1 Uncharacterised protein [Chryseobacterium carnipullorum]
MKKSIIYILLHIFSIYYVEAQVGINTNAPTKTLDINGDLRIRNVQEGSVTDQIVTSDSQGNVGKLAGTQSQGYVFGDIKTGFQAADHQGWYLLDGRAVSTLSANAQSQAISLGFTTNIPDATGRFLKASSVSNQVAQLGGFNSVSLVQANLPSYNYTGNTTSDNASHNHLMSPDLYYFSSTTSGSVLVTMGNVNNPLGANNRLEHSETSVTSASGDHSHAFSIANAGGSGEAINILPQYIGTNTFIYLGQ